MFLWVLTRNTGLIGGGTDGRLVICLYDCTHNVRTTMGTKRVNFRLPEELIAQADVAAEVTHKNRTEILIEALRQYLEHKESDESFREAVVELYLDDQIEFERLTEVIGRQDAESVRASKQVLDRGEELADDLAEL